MKSFEEIIESLTPEQFESVKAFAWAVKNDSVKDTERLYSISRKWEQNKDAFYTNVNYRIKPQPKLVPFDFGDAEKLKGSWVKVKKGKVEGCWQINGITQLGVRFASNGYTFQTLLDEYEFTNGSPCGKEA